MAAGGSDERSNGNRRRAKWSLGFGIAKVCHRCPLESAERRRAPQFGDSASGAGRFSGRQITVKPSQLAPFDAVARRKPLLAGQTRSPVSSGSWTWRTGGRLAVSRPRSAELFQSGKTNEHRGIALVDGDSHDETTRLDMARLVHAALGAVSRHNWPPYSGRTTRHRCRLGFSLSALEVI